MPIEVIAGRTPEDLFPAVTPVMHYFGASPVPQDAPRWAFIEPSRAFLAREGERVVGGCGSFPLEVTVPGGGTVACAGLSIVGVLPTHRRRGILRQMMRAQLDDVRRRGEPIGMLWASEDGIYGQFGYGQASMTGEIEIAKAHVGYARPFEPRGEFRLLTDAEALAPLAEAYERARPAHPGMLKRSADWWKARRLSDPENRRQGGGELNRVLLSLDGRPAGYALYRIFQKFEAGSSAGYVHVNEAVAANAEATRELWRFLLDIDWVAKIRSGLLPLDHPLLFLLARPREMNLRVRDGLWVRLVDLPKAIAARRLGDAPPVVIEVADAFCDWNAGRWRVSAKGAERTSDAAELACDVTALGSVYLGGYTFRQLAAALRVVEITPGAIARADALFPSDGAPWCPEIF